MRNPQKITKEVLGLLPKRISKPIYKALKDDILFIIPEKTHYITKLHDKMENSKSKFWINGLTILYDGQYFVYFSSTEYKKNKAEGCKILAHELTHVYQYLEKDEWIFENSLPFEEYDNDLVEKEAEHYGDYVKHKLKKLKL